MKPLRVTALCVTTGLLVFLFVSSVSAQKYRAQVRGLVLDQTGAALPGATVTLLNPSTGIKAVKETDNSGLYVFDYVDPGAYSVTVEAAGFGRFVQENISVQSGGDITVNATLSPGSLQQSVTVSDSPPAVEFNSTNQQLTIDTKLANETPRLDRNAFKLTLLEPAAINTRGEMQPYHSWAANSVDAESGHSAGGIISLTTKAGTNEWHGNAFYLGRYPWLSAEADRTTFTQNAQRQNMYGGTLGNPIIKNKLFNYYSMEYWKIGSPGSYNRTVPTALER